MNRNWNKAYIDAAGRICYQSGHTIYCEELQGGRLRSLGWNNAGTGVPDGMPDPNPFLNNNVFALSLNGVDLVYDYEYAGADAAGSFTVTAEEGAVHAVLALTAPKFALDIRLHTRLFGGDVMLRWLELTNRGEAPMLLGKTTVFGGALFAGEPAEVGYFSFAEPGGEGDYHTQTLPVGSFALRREHYVERYRQPFCTCRRPGGDTTFICEMAYSGGFEMRFDTRFSGAFFTEFAASLSGHAPLRVIAPGEVFATPEVFFGMIKGDTDAAIHEMHRAIHANYAEFSKTCAVEASVGPGACEEEDIAALMEKSAELGAEIFYIDAGWYIKKGRGTLDWPGPCGDWTRTPDRYTSTLDDFRERAHSLGMKFGLWMDVEKLGWESETYQQHKAPRLKSYTGADMQDGPCSAMLDVTTKEGAEWAYGQIKYVLDTYRLDYFRLDSGTFPPEACSEVLGYRENSSLRYYEAWYALFKRLRREYPDVVFQNCSGGGMRCDVGMTGMMSNTWISDVNSAPTSFRIVNGMSMMLPVEYLVKIIYDMGAQFGGTLDFIFGVARFGSPLIPLSLIDRSYDMNDSVKAKTAAMIESYKSFIRPMLHDCLTYHHTPVAPLGAPDGRGVLEIASPDKRCALLSVFTLGPVVQSRSRVHFAGIDPSLDYRLYCNDVFIGIRHGWELTQGFDCDISIPCDARCYIADAVRE